MTESAIACCRKVHEDGFPAPLRAPWMEAGVGEFACWAGDTSLLERPLRVAVIGTREPSAASSDAVEAVCTHLVGQSAVIVSGAAKGTDTGAHRAALEAGGGTIACLPFGTGFLAGRESGSRGFLLRGLREGGVLLLSPFAGRQPPTRQTPVVRNRLIASLAHAVVVGEAREGSGTYHCVRFAVELGRPVFILRQPGEASPALEQLRRESARRSGGRLIEPEECLGEALAREVAAAARKFAADVRERDAAQGDLLRDVYPR